VAFWTLKSVLVSAPVIQPPDWSQPFEIMCDASDVDGAFWYTKHVHYTLVWISLWN
jgi:hypothetical protein